MNLILLPIFHSQPKMHFKLHYSIYDEQNIPFEGELFETRKLISKF